MPGKPPYFPLYARDFVADGKVVAMTTEQTGAYALLLCYAWLEDPAGSIPNNDRILSKWVKMPMNKWLKTRDEILSPFELRGGRYFQKRMVAEFLKLSATISRAADKGAKGAQKRWQGHSPSNAQGMAPAYESDSASDSGSGISHGVGVRGRGKSDPPGFAEFWRQYPRKEAKPRAVKAWISLGPDDETQSAIMAGVARLPAYGPHELQFCPHPASWLNARRWEDETKTLNGKPPVDLLAGVREFMEAHRDDAK